MRFRDKMIAFQKHNLDEVLCLNRHCCAYGDPLEVFTDDVIKELYGSHSSMFLNHSLGNHGHNDGI